MKLIGIIGKSGSGKTTLSRMLQKDDSISVIHLDEVTDMKQIKSRLPDGIVDKNIYSNNQGEEFMVLNKNVRKIRDALIKSSLLRRLYYGILHFPREKLLKNAINSEIEQGKETIVVEGAILGEYSIYDKFDYLIRIDAPFVEREKRVIERKDVVFDKDTMVNRDIEFKQAHRKGLRKRKKVDQVIQNTGTKEALQVIADKIYSQQIQTKSTNRSRTMREKYGGYKARPVSISRQTKGIKKDDLIK